MMNPLIRLTLAGAAFASLLACEAFEDSQLSLVAPASVPADGASIHDVEVCAIADDVGAVDVRLQASSGEWLVPTDPNRPGETIVRLDPTTLCGTDRWIVPDDLRPVRFSAIVDGESLAETETNLTLTRIEAVDFSPSTPFLSADGQTVITIEVQGQVASPGDTAGVPGPTIGSKATLTVESDPPSLAALDTSNVVFGSAQTRTLSVAAGTRQVTVTARDGVGGRVLGDLILRVASP